MCTDQIRTLKTEYTNDSKKKSKAQSKDLKLRSQKEGSREPDRREKADDHEIVHEDRKTSEALQGSRNDSEKRFKDNILLPECYPNAIYAKPEIREI